METHFSLSWDAYQKNICTGLSVLQQRGEFVDMTLAADGHHVKVHQMVLSLVSPYIKDLISSAQCPHPVIFLNNISYTTLCSVLEYIYTGEVNLPKDSLPDLLAAGRALHIKGLQEMEQHTVIEDNSSILNETIMLQDDTMNIEDFNSDLQAIDDENEGPVKKTLLEQLQKCKENKKFAPKPKKIPPLCKIFVNDDTNTKIVEEFNEIINTSSELNEESHTDVLSSNELDVCNSKIISNTSNIVQYSLSNQGGLQMIYNRYIYALKYVQKKLIKVWRCGSKRCPANIYTNENNQVIKRTFQHNHSFHDKNILKKMRLGLIFTAFNEAESRACSKRENKDPPPSKPQYNVSE